jgi:Reverse transcriptase (RNA-dependent DNA polymerase)
MYKKRKNAWHYRPLLTETLPYELPVIFGNEGLYYGRSKNISSEATSVLENIFSKADKVTIPYNYSIRKDSSRQTLLSMIHPLLQLEFCDFYAQYENALLDQCRRSQFSLRHPAALAAVYVAKTKNDEVTHKVGQVELRPNDIEVELSKLVSYFSYEKYALLNKFYESKEFVRLEKRFSCLRQIDISKCFYGIYTHSLAWATRSKDFAKSNLDTYYFEAAFDKLMQRANHNETNGIVVGPEISRIFAEIILQGVDVAVQSELRLEYKLVEGQDYSIRRYVDDFSIFSNTNENLTKIEKVIRDHLGKFKLYVNESKVRNFERPFVTSLSQARTALRASVGNAKRAVTSENWEQGAVLSSDQRHSIGGLLNSVRSIVHQYDVQVGHISGSLLGDLRSLVRMSNRKIAGGGSDWATNWSYTIQRVLECAFYVAAVDLRVRTTYGLCQLLSLITNMRSAVSKECWHQIEYLVTEELVLLCKLGLKESDQHSRKDPVELFNALICGAHNLGSGFLRLPDVVCILDKVLDGDFTYFKYISLKFCLLKDNVFFASQLEELNKKALATELDRNLIRQNSESFHLFCDLLSAPDLSTAQKRDLYKKIFGGNPSNATLDEVAKVIGFVDWNGVAIEHTLRRRQLRPVYAVA